MQVAFGMGMHTGEVRRFQEAVDKLERKGVARLVVVPLLVSSYSEVYRQYEYLLGLRQDAAWPEAGGPLRLEVPVVMGRALDDHELVAEVLLERASALSRDPAKETVVLLAHGPTAEEDNAQWLARLQRLAERIKTQGEFARVIPMTFRDDAPKPVRDQAVRELRAVIAQAGGVGPVLIVPVLIAEGGVENKIPKMLSGLTFEFSGKTLLPHPNVERWIAEQAQSLARPDADPAHSGGAS
jgi:sirohydrochlorin ferrochelatase